MRHAALILMAFLLTTTALLAQPKPASKLNPTKVFLLPPPMTPKSAAPVIDPAAGESITIDDTEKQFTLFLPKAWKASASTNLVLTVHFMGDVPTVVSEHLDHGMTTPIAVVAWGTGTETYRLPFKNDTNRFAVWLKLVEQKLQDRGAPENSRITAVSVSAYGGGYGAVREIIKSEQILRLMRRIVLCDAMYASYTKERDANGNRRISPEHFDPWLPFVKAAVKGEKTFVFTFSQIPTTGYASCSECAAALAEEIGVPLAHVELDSCAAANQEDYPLLTRSDLGNFHEWGYAGVGDDAHAVHLKHLGDIWKVLDEAGKP